jgi:two-component system, OmpR family, alkaline phosphatase synthesis response regulator PhoP
MAKRILVVEDEPRILAVVRKRLEVAGHRVITAMDGIEALQVARREKPDLIVLDLMLPRKDGYEVCVELKADPACSPIPILMLTARIQDQEINRGMASGADGYMLKPFDGKQFADRVAQLLDQAEVNALRHREQLGEI